MKELTIEEKAKRYDEAIKLVNSKWYYRNQPCFINVSELFPEFKENKNENIKKWLIEYFQEYKSTGIEGFANGLKIDSIITWIENQINDEDIYLLKLKAKAYDDAKERMSNAYNKNRVSIGFINEIFPNLNLYENQNEQNSNDIDFKAKDYYVSQVDGKIHNAALVEQNTNKVKQQQTIDIPFDAKDSELQETTYYIPDGYHAEINGNEVIIKKDEQKTPITQYCYILNYNTGKVFKHCMTEDEVNLTTEELLKKYGFNEDECSIMYSSNNLELELLEN